MKKLSYLLFLTTIFMSCQQNPFKDLDDFSYKDRNLETLLVENQVGTLIIEDANVVSDTGYATIKVINGTEINALKVKDIAVSFGATADVGTSSVLNFDNADSTVSIVVTAQSGEQRTWKVKATIYKSLLEGKWHIDSYELWFDVLDGGEGWGWSGTSPLVRYMPGAALELDNEFEFVSENIDEQGNVLGTFTHSAGADEKYGEYIYDPGGGNEKDFTDYFSKMPTEAGTWKRDFERNVIVFNEGQGDEVTTEPLELDKYEQEGILIVKFSVSFPSVDWSGYPLEEITSAQAYWYGLKKGERQKSGENDITSFSIGENNGRIDSDNHKVEVDIADGTNIATLAPTITTSALSTISPASGEIVDFTTNEDSTVKYTVTAENGSMQDWTAKLILLSEDDDGGLEALKKWLQNSTNAPTSWKNIWNIAEYYIWDGGKVRPEWADAEMDNQLTLNDNLTFVYSAGDDNKYGSATAAAAEGYRLLPQGSGTWKFDDGSKKLIFKDEFDIEHSWPVDNEWGFLLKIGANEEQNPLDYWYKFE